MAEMAVEGEGATLDAMKKLARDICSATTEKDKDKIRNLIKVVFVELEGKIMIEALEDQQVGLVKIIISNTQCYELAAEKLIGKQTQPPVIHFNNAIDM